MTMDEYRLPANAATPWDMDAYLAMARLRPLAGRRLPQPRNTHDQSTDPSKNDHRDVATGDNMRRTRPVDEMAAMSRGRRLNLEGAMRRISSLLSIAVATVAGITALPVSAAAVASAVCVGADPGCYHSLQAAIDAAPAGSVVRIHAGTFRGGVTVSKDLHLAGAGAGPTIISGGDGPVLTIGTFGATTEPTVTLQDLTITGGRTSSSPFGSNVAVGGGVFVPPAKHFGVGATVTIIDSVITGNRVAPRSTAPSSNAMCPSGPCPFALAAGGGIGNFGVTTLSRTTVSNNEASGDRTSDADGGGISSQAGSLTLRRSVVAENRAVASAPNGRFAEGGGIQVTGGSLTLDGSRVNRNRASLTSSLPSFAGGSVIELGANSGAIHVGDGIPTRVENSDLADNVVTAADPRGEALAFDSAMLVGDSPLIMWTSVIQGNRVSGTSATSTDVGPGGSAVELDGGGTISNTRITGNSSAAFSSAGAAAVNGGLAVLNFNNDPRLVTVTDSIIAGNTVTARSRTGSATVQGAGIFNNSLLELRGVRVTGNSGKATGPHGMAQGGGIWNGVELSAPGTPVRLTMTDTTVAQNSLAAGPGLPTQGGGLYTTCPVTLINTTIRRNAPDNLFGVTSCAASRADISNDKEIVCAHSTRRSCTQLSSSAPAPGCSSRTMPGGCGSPRSS